MEPHSLTVDSEVAANMVVPSNEIEEKISDISENAKSGEIATMSIVLEGNNERNVEIDNRVSQSEDQGEESERPLPLFMDLFPSSISAPSVVPSRIGIPQETLPPKPLSTTMPVEALAPKPPKVRKPRKPKVVAPVTGPSGAEGQPLPISGENLSQLLVSGVAQGAIPPPAPKVKKPRKPKAVVSDKSSTTESANASAGPSVDPAFAANVASSIPASMTPTTTENASLLPVNVSESAASLAVSIPTHPKKPRKQRTPKVPKAAAQSEAPKGNEVAVEESEEEVDEPPDEELLKKVKEVDETITELEQNRQLIDKRLKEHGFISGSSRKAKDGVDESLTRTLDGGKAHWDHLLDEMAWMSNDFRVERKWKVHSAKKLVREAERTISKKEQEKKKEKVNRVSNLRQQSKRIARDVRKLFWNKIDRIVVFKNNADFLAEQQEIMDRNLDRLLEQTEQYTASLVSTSLKQLQSKKGESKQTSEQELEQLEVEAISKMMSKYAEMPVWSKKRRSRTTRNAASTTDGSGGLPLNGVVSSSGEKTAGPSPSDGSTQALSDLMSAKNLGENNDDEEDASWQGSVEEDEEDSDMNDDDPEDDGRIDKLEADLEIPIEELLEREYNISRNTDSKDSSKEESAKVKKRANGKTAEKKSEKPASSASALTAEFPTDRNEDGPPSKRLRSATTLHPKPDSSSDSAKAKSTAESKMEHDEDDESWSGGDEEEVDDEIDAEDENNPEDDGTEDALAADQSMSLEELLARTYGISLDKFKEDAKKEGDDAGEEKNESVGQAVVATTTSADRSKKKERGKKSNQEDGAEEPAEKGGEVHRAEDEAPDGEDDESWHGEDEADEEIASEDLNIEDDDGNIDGLEDDLNLPIEELLARRYGIGTATTTTAKMEEEEQAEPTEEQIHEAKRKADLQTLVEGNAEDAGDDDSYQPSTGESDSEDERALLEAEAEEEGDATAEDLAKDAAIPIEEILRTQYHMEGQIGKEMDDEKMDELVEEEEDADKALFADNGKKKKMATATTEDVTTGKKEVSGVETKHNKEKMSAEEIEKLLTQSAEEEIREHVPVPFLLTQDRQLRTYQREGLDWLVSLHDRQLNGILADEMGLGKTAQTISLLAHLAGSCNIWGPHLVVVPTSVILNWDMEFKTWCPGLKVITYFGTQAERAAKRAGWTKPNAFHVCVTSYQIAVQDHNVFQRKKWYYIICDEAHALKNSASKRWQTLLSFQAKRRLLITGTPLQNSLMELWSLMHFLMPEVFRSQHEFRHWFSNPLQAIVEEGDKRNAGAVKRLHTVMRPFILRRLKREVATQLPSKFEHVVRLPLARRQRFLYEDFISLSSTQDQLRSGGYVGMMSVLMKLRMVCNHPDLFEPRMVSAALCLDEFVPSIPQSAENIFQEPSKNFPYVGLSVADGEFGSVGDVVVGLPENAKLGSRLAAERALQLAPSQEQMDAIWRNAAGASLPLPMNVNQALPSAPDYVKHKIHELYERKSQEYLSDKISAGRQVCLLNRRRLEGSIPVFGSERISCLRISRKRFGVPDSLYLYEDSLEARLDELSPVLERFVFVTPVAQGRVRCPLLSVQKAGEKAIELLDRSIKTNPIVANNEALLHPVAIRQRIAFPDRYLVQYDCGKLQTLAVMLRRLKRDNHRVLIFTQMSRMLDILERFLNLHSHTYFRLDGATKVEERQSMMDRFNRDPRIFCFILSTRSGGLGINLTGADTVIFYDSDWNPSMDAQAQDRAHRIGQTRDVHIYRLVSEQTIEENILLKSNQKRHLNRLSVEDGRFSKLLSGIDLSNEEALAAVEDESDRAATLRAKREELEMMGEEVEDDDNENDDDEEENEDGQERKKPTTTTTTTTNNAGEDGGDDEKLEDEKGNVLMTKAQFQELQSKLKPVDVYAIDFRTKHFLILDPLKDARRQKELERARLMEEQTKEWELEALEQSKRKAEAEAEEDMIANKDNVLDDATANAVLRSARRCLKLERKLRKMTGRSWRKAFEKRPGEKRAFYINDDTLETTWERPRIMDAEEERSRCRQSGWGKMHSSVLERIALFLPSDQVHLFMARVNSHWYKAVEGSPRLAVFVPSPTYAREEDETGTLMVGSRIEARHLNGENWFPATVIDCQRDGCLGVLYTDGEVEHRLQPSMVRRDKGSRITLVRRFEGDKPFGPVFEYLNPILASGFGCGAPPVDPLQAKDILRTMGEYVLSNPGTSFVLRPGTHSIGSGGVFGGPKTRLIGETVWAMEKDSYRTATERLLPDDDPKKRNDVVKFDPSNVDPFDLARASVIGNPEAGDMYVDVAGGELVGIYFAVRVAVRADKDVNVKFRFCRFVRGLDVVSASKVELDACFFAPCVDRPAIVAGSDPMATIVLKRCSLAGSLMGLYFSGEEDVDLSRVSVVECDLSNCLQGAVGTELNQTTQLLQRVTSPGNNNVFTPGLFVRPVPLPNPLLAQSSNVGGSNKEAKFGKDKMKKKRIHKGRKSVLGAGADGGVAGEQEVSKVKKAKSPKKKKKKKRMKMEEVTVLDHE